MNCVGIDISKGKSMIAVMRPLGEMVIPPFEVGHTDAALCELSRLLGKLASYGLDHWLTLPRYIPEDEVRLMPKTTYRQYQQCAKVQTMLKNNLISLLDTAFPDANRLFTSPARIDGRACGAIFPCVRKKKRSTGILRTASTPWAKK